ncbi:hypothetical protein Tam1G_0092 [Bifidobacterium imperatoris]|uniref:Uncharacterized protein n=1 Tax=Bifidobacterium imperatoris TaxID=2020965 RepID=A0A2N5IVE7_9BIFI|nr:hypothetical protein Tam1G_0092 [Bifidobacterium imperatoris]
MPTNSKYYHTLNMYVNHIHICFFETSVIYSHHNL